MADDPDGARMQEADTAAFELPPPVARAVELTQDRKVKDLVVLDLRGISTATDYFVIGSGRSDIQVRAISEHVVAGLKEVDQRPSHIEGMEGGRWVLLDYVDFVVHIFHPAPRDFYQLERLWGDAPRIAFRDPEEDGSGESG